jgi:TPR repeat protein
LPTTPIKHSLRDTLHSQTIDINYKKNETRNLTNQKMNFKIKLTLILFLAITFNINAQDCESIRAKAIQLETSLDKANPKTYYEYAEFISKQLVSGNNCVNKEVINSLYSILVQGAKNGSIRCAARLVMVSQYGLYNYPTHRDKAFEISMMFLKLAIETYESDPALYNEFGYIIPTIYLRLYLQNESWRYDFNSSPELAAAVFELFKLGETPAIKESDKNSFKLVKKDYSKVCVYAYLSGSFGTTINYTKGIEEANKIDESYRNGWIIKILKDHSNDVDFSNPAALAFLGAREGKKWYYISDVNTYSNTIYQANISKVNSELLFEQSYDDISAPLKEIIDAAYPEYKDIAKKWEVVNKSRLKEPESYPQWKFLPKNEQESLYSEASKGEKSTLKKKEQFQIYKAMVASGQNKALIQLANAYKLGEGVFPIGNQAIKTYEKALVYPSLKEEAAFNLAEIYDGCLDDIAVNWVEAAKYYKMATNYNPKSYTMLGEMALFGVGGFTQSKTTAIEYFKNGYDNGDKDAYLKSEIIQLLPYTNNEIINENSITMTVTYNVPQGLEKNTFKLFPSQNYNSAIKYGTWSPSAILTGEGEEDIIIYNNKFRKGSRQIGVFYIVGENQNEFQSLVYEIPVAICFLPQK